MSTKNEDQSRSNGRELLVADDQCGEDAEQETRDERITVLSELLGISLPSTNTTNDGQANNGNESTMNPPSGKKPLIQVLDEGDESEIDGSDDEPPTLSLMDATMEAVDRMKGIPKTNESNKPEMISSEASLMDKMMEEATKARQEKIELKRAEERKHAKDSMLGTGLKKGFLSSNRVSKKGTQKKLEKNSKEVGASKLNKDTKVSMAKLYNPRAFVGCVLLVLILLSFPTT